MKDVEKEPVASVVVVATIEPSNVMVTLEEAAKPQPETVTIEPTVPEVGLRTQIAGNEGGLVGVYDTMFCREVLLQRNGETNVSSRWAVTIVTSELMVHGVSG